MPNVHTCIWFDNQAEEAALFYTALVPDSEIGSILRNPGGAPGSEVGAVIQADFTLAGQRYVALNGGPMFPLTEAVSIVLTCETQAEADRYWEALTADGGAESMCGWCKDRFGLSWQIVPQACIDLISDPDPEVSRRAVESMMTMQRLDSEVMARAARP